MVEDVLSHNVPFWVLVRLIVYALPTIIALSVPFAVLVGGLMAVGRLSSDGEIVSFRACGFSLWFAFIPFLIWGGVLSIFSFFVNDYLLPRGTFRFINLYVETFFAHPELELQAFSVKSYQDDIIVTGAIEEGVIQSIFIAGPDEQGDYRIISAHPAQIVNPDPDRGIVTLLLENVFIHTASRDKPEYYKVTEAKSMQYNFLIRDIAQSSIHDLGPREMSSANLRKVIQEKDKAFQTKLASYNRLVDTLKYMVSLEYYRKSMINTVLQKKVRAIHKKTPFSLSLQVYNIEYYKKFSLPFSSVCFILFAFPAGLFAQRSGRSVGFGVGLFVSSLYWSLLVMGQSLGGVNKFISPLLAMWFPNIFMTFLGIFTFLLRIRK